MPGRVVRILVKEGDAVTMGQTVIVVSAMKMESEYKAAKDGVIKHVHVKEGEVVNGHQPLITIE
jgi:biotin carboxyl carrier protein